MHINTTVRHFELAHDDRQFAHTRLEKFTRFARDIQEIHLVVTAESYRHVAEITLRLKHREVVVRGESNGPRRAIDLAAERIERQLRRVHEQRIARRREGRATDGVGERPAGGEAAMDEADTEEFGDLEEA